MLCGTSGKKQDQQLGVTKQVKQLQGHEKAERISLCKYIYILIGHVANTEELVEPTVKTQPRSISARLEPLPYA